MKGNLQQCIDYIHGAKEKSILLRAGDEYVAVKLRSARGDDATAENIIGVFTRKTPVDVIIYEAS